MTTLVDSNVLLDVFTDDETWSGWSRERLLHSLQAGTVVVNQIIYAEVSAAFAHEKELVAALERLGVERASLPYTAAFPAMRAFIKYRRHGGLRKSPLPDFYIGAHAESEKMVLLTRDGSRYRSYFPELRLNAPDRD